MVTYYGIQINSYTDLTQTCNISPWMLILVLFTSSDEYLQESGDLVWGVNWTFVMEN